MVQPKELYKGKCLNDLSEHYTLPDVRNHKILNLCRTAKRLHDEAEKAFIDVDEELSYIYFMKYFNLVNTIHKLPDYKKEKKFVSEILGTNDKQTRAFDKVENLSKNLKRRYELLASQEKALKDLDELEQHHKYREKLNADIEREKANKHDKVDETSTMKMSEVVTSDELYSIMKDTQHSVLIMDCRSLSDYSASHIVYSYIINVPEEILQAGMSAGKIQQELSNEYKALWASRGIRNYVVLVDWSSTGPEPIQNTPIWRLKDILQNWDPDITYNSPIFILDGGYENFLLVYPTQTTNANVKPPNNCQSDYEILNDIEYPSINDIVMKDVSLSQTYFNNDSHINELSIPGVDRNSKAAALKMYEERNKKLSEILEEQEHLAGKSLDNEKELLMAESDWEHVRLQREKEAVEEQKVKLYAREQELMYNLLQLENKHLDYKLENDRLREELEAYKNREKEMQSRGDEISEQEAALLEEGAAKRIKQKEEERRQIDEQREIMAHEREKKLAFAREQKRHLNEGDVNDDEGISKAKIPQFDRSVKPAVISLNEYKIQRDFSPIPGSPGRGLTGLKNLGNTCYMNSIMQCISNTNCLAEIFIVGSYRKHINKSNKTQGRIAEEVAAVVRALWSGQYKYIASKDLRYFVGQYQQTFRGFEQQDSHEFLTILMDWLHSDLQTIVTSGKESLKNTLPASERSWLDFTKSRESFMLRLFYGQIKSTVKCVECGKESATYESFSTLSLELPPSTNRCQIQNCLDMYFNGESIRGWNCPRCKQKRDAVKKLDISKLPPILVIHFKRFYADVDSLENTYRKKQNYVNFPLVGLDMAPYVARSEMRNKARTNRSYSLYGVSNHYGSMESGHYTAFCKSSTYGKWYKFDDHVVSQLDSSDVRSSAAYILFYTALSEAPPPEIR